MLIELVVVPEFVRRVEAIVLVVEPLIPVDTLVLVVGF